jgi:hypothetical protein
LGGRGKERPFSYNTIEKTFYSFFIYGDLLQTPLNYRMDEGENPRELEKEQILKLMNLIAEKLYIGRLDQQIGTARVENRVQNNEDIAEDHLAAYRMAREEILYGWLQFVRQIVESYFITTGKTFKAEKLFQYRFPEPLWDNIENFLMNLRKLPLWVNRDLSATVFGGKQTTSFGKQSLKQARHRRVSRL